MELRQLVCVEAVARLGGFTRAAEELHVAQPWVSAQVRRLERELGAELFRRTTRRVEVTEAGELLLVRVRRVLRELDGIRADLADLAGVLRGRVRLGVVDALGPFDLHAALAAFHRGHPGVEVEVCSAPIGRMLLDRLDAGGIDLALAPTPPGLPDRYLVEPLFAEELVVVAPPGHRITGLGAVPMAELRDEPFVCFPAPSGLRTILEDHTGAAGFVPAVPVETTDLGRIRGLVSTGIGVALVARSVAEGPGPPVVVRSLGPEPVHRGIGLLQLDGRTLAPAAAACRRVLVGFAPGPRTHGDDTHREQVLDPATVPPRRWEP